MRECVIPPACRGLSCLCICVNPFPLDLLRACGHVFKTTLSGRRPQALSWSGTHDKLTERHQREAHKVFIRSPRMPEPRYTEHSLDLREREHEASRSALEV